ncbi:MAG TPA: aldolase/citrate lyase family protein [Dehalococcoidia bacterium]|nr:aldolase/citrate lyase family protein [Dehalococcoidia bacterium]
MRLNTTKQKLADGATVTGVIINENAPASLELLGRIGCFDFVMIDCEHGPMSLFDVENLVRACEGAGLTPLARVPDHAPSTILRFLDRGVQGVIVPHVNTAEQALAIARAGRYYPEGDRSIGSTRAHDYNVDVSRAESTRFINENVLVIPMCEHVDAIKNLDAILRVPGIDVVHIAANDLAQSMGFPPEAEVRNAMLGAIAKARAAGIGAGVGGNNPGDAGSVAALVKAGANFVTISASGLLRLGADTFRASYEAALT